MKQVFIFLYAICAFSNCVNTNEIGSRALIIDLLENTHENQNWFVPTKSALADLSIDQVNYKDSVGIHSIAELVSHLIFWNKQQLDAFSGKVVDEFKGNNNETFQTFTDLEWESLLGKLDSIQTSWENQVRTASPKKLSSWASEIANMTAHTSYHTGQIVLIRKQNGWWK